MGANSILFLFPTLCHLQSFHLSLSSMKLAASLLRPSFRRRLRLRSNATFRRSNFFTRKRAAATSENPEPSSPKVTCIGQVRVQSQKKVNQYRRRIGEASFRSTDHPPPPPPRWVHLPNISVVLRAFGKEFCCLFRCRCCRYAKREREKRIKYADENGCGTMLGRWLVAEGGRRQEIEVVVGGGDEEMLSAGNSRRHVFDDIEVNGDRIEVKGRSLEGESTTFSICIPPKNALLLMRCRSDPLKMAAIANRISSDAAKYAHVGIEETQVEECFDESLSSEEFVEGKHKVYVAQVLVKEMHNVEDCKEKLVITTEEKVEEIEQEFNEEEEEEKEETESNMLSFEALLDQENTLPDQDFAEHNQQNQDATIGQEVEEEENTVKSDKLEAVTPESQETTTKKESATPALPECLLLMMREPKLSMEVSKETWVCATDFIRLLPERPRRAAAKVAAAASGGDHEPIFKRRASIEKSRPRVPAPPGKRNDVQPARSSCSLPAAMIERKRMNGGGACEPLALTRCKSETMSTAAAKLMPEAGVGAAGVGF